MNINPETIQFIHENLNSDTSRLLLNASKYPAIDMPFAVDQILGRKQIREKLPYWYACESLVIPSRIAAEQCSSEQTASYKTRLVKGDSVCDLTGGMGVDSYYMSRATSRSFYIERYPEYCETARYNFELLGAKHITVLNGDSRELLREIDRCDTFYIDPARRSDVNKRLFALSDCEPDVLGIKDELLSKGERLIIKISPMADIRMTLELLPETTEIHILSVRNECKELLFVLDRIDGIRPEPTLYGINFTNDGTEDRFQFTLSEEQNAAVKYSSQPDKYIYEPNASILKAGGFKSIASRFDLKKLHINSHLYTSDELLTDFPGRAFRVEEVIDFSSKNIKKLSNRIPKANITVRNFPLTVEEIRKKTGIKDGGSVYLFATTVGKDEKMLLNCTKTNK